MEKRITILEDNMVMFTEQFKRPCQMQIFPFDTPFLLFGLCESETGNWKLENTMLLSQQRMKELLPFFQKFAETGELK